MEAKMLYDWPVTAPARVIRDRTAWLTGRREHTAIEWHRPVTATIRSGEGQYDDGGSASGLQVIPVCAAPPPPTTAE